MIVTVRLKFVSEVAQMQFGVFAQKEAILKFEF